MAKNQMQRRSDDGNYGDVPGQGRQMVAKRTVQDLNAFLNKGIGQFAAALPKHMTADRLIRTALTAATKTPKLLECTQASFALAMLNAAALGLETNGRDAHLVPFKGQVQLIPGYQGLTQLAYRSGQVAGITAKAVYEKDYFKYELGTSESLIHKPTDDENPGKLTHAWAMCRFKDGATKFVVLNRRDVMKRKASSQTSGRSDSPWNVHEEAMWAKSAVRELAKWIPQVAEMSQAVALEEMAERGETQIMDDKVGMHSIFGEFVDEQQPAETKSDELANRLGGGRETAAPKQPEPESPQNALGDGARFVQKINNAPTMDNLNQIWEMVTHLPDDAFTESENLRLNDAYEARARQLSKAEDEQQGGDGELFDKGGERYE